MPRFATAVSTSALAALTLGLSASAWAGPPNPPAGPVAPTYKTLSEVQPRTIINTANTPGDITAVYRITQPGSYYLTGNMTVPSGKSGIVVMTPNVHIDLSGFTIAGQAGSVNGISNVGGSNQVYVHDGSVVSMGGAGIDLSYQIGMIVRNVTVKGCTGNGIEVASGSVVESCVVQECAIGIFSGFHSVIRDCAVRNCTEIGIRVEQGSLAENCTSGFNTLHGFRMLSGAQAHGCIAMSNFADGFNADVSCRIESCNAIQNSGDGFDMGTYSEVRNSYATDNTGAGVMLTGSYSIANGNTCRSNSAFGIRAAGTACLVVRNIVAAPGPGPNYSFVAGTRHGPIVLATGSAGAVSVTAAGFAAGSFSTTDPNANLNY